MEDTFINNYEHILSRFRKGLYAQHSLLKLLEKWKQSLYQGLVFGDLFTKLTFQRLLIFFPINY